MIRTIVFDFGNVIAHFSHRLATQRLAVHAGLSADELHGLLFGGRLADDYESGRLSTRAFLEHLRRTCGLRCSEAELADAYADIFWPNPEVCSLVPRLKPGYRLLLLSNTNELHAERFRRQFEDTLQHFDALVFSHQVGARKPRPEIFEHCRRLAGCDASECLFIDDLPANVKGARACGWRGIVYRKGGELPRQLERMGVVLA
jgi:putative hydrolase of the HAD superfamily